MSYLKTLAPLMAVAILLVSNSNAQENVVNPDCVSKVCKPVVETKKEKTSCFKVECKEICVPKVRLPWQKCCEPQCGIVKKVKVLKTVSGEKEKCTYKWEITDGAPCESCVPGCRPKLHRPFRCQQGCCKTICDCDPRCSGGAIITVAKRIQAKVQVQDKGSVASVSDEKNNAYYELRPKR